MKPRIYIDGKEGTTGLQIYERLGARDDIELLLIEDDKRKDLSERRRLINAADLIFLCLPDAAAAEAVSLIENDHTRVIDASTAHRTARGWVYGFPELYQKPEETIGKARFVANPGCHATGFLSTVAPLVALHILPPDYPLTCYSLTGYSGGGKKMIAEYEADQKAEELYSPRVYGTNLRHKHLPEMQKVAGLERPPVFCPVVDDYYKGMETTVMLHTRYLKGQPTAEELALILSAYYAQQPLVSVSPYTPEGTFLAANALAGTDRLEITVSGYEDQAILTARFDNLGKGASGAAVQNMNLMLGLEPTTGLKR